LKDTTITNEQIAELKAKLAEMGLDESAMLYELGLSERDPFAADRTTSATPAPPRYDEEKDNEAEPSADVSGSPAGDSEDVPLSDEELDAALSETTLTDEQKDELKEIMKALGVGAGVITPVLEVLGLFTGEGQGVLPQQSVPDLIEELETIETKEDLQAWRDKVMGMDFSILNKKGLHYMASLKEDSWSEGGREYDDMLADQWKTPQQAPMPKLNAEDYASNVDLYLLLQDVQTQNQGISPQDAWNRVYEIQNQYDQTIIDSVVGTNDVQGYWQDKPDIQSLLVHITKRLIMNESQFRNNLVTGDEKGTGLGQVTPGTLQTLVNFGYVEGDANQSYLFDPTYNIQATQANLRFLYDGIVASNEKNSWAMEDEEVLKFAVALHNSGYGGDWGEGNRFALQRGDFTRRGECFDPTKWECLQLLWVGNVDAERTIHYVDNIFLEDIDAPPREDK
jgi:hypothetical protein